MKKHRKPIIKKEQDLSGPKKTINFCMWCGEKHGAKTTARCSEYLQLLGYCLKHSDMPFWQISILIQQYGNDILSKLKSEIDYYKQ